MQVRQQTCDLINLMKWSLGKSFHYMFMEDDFVVCPGTIKTLVYAIKKVRRGPTREGGSSHLCNQLSKVDSFMGDVISEPQCKGVVDFFRQVSLNVIGRPRIWSPDGVRYGFRTE